jgi:hypothetical protein
MIKKPESEIHSDAWSRFERAVDVVAKSPPQHRKPKPTDHPKNEKPTASGRRVSRAKE